MMLWQAQPSLEEFLSLFKSQVSSDGAKASFQKLEEVWGSTLLAAQTAKIHVTEVFIIKALQQVTEGRAQDESEASQAEIRKGLSVLSKQEAVVSSLALGVGQGDFNPFVIRMLADTVQTLKQQKQNQSADIS